MITATRRHTFIYACSCVDCSDGRFITRMVDEAVDVTYETVLKHCRGLLEWAEQKGYFRHPQQGLTLKNDRHVTYHRSRFKGLPCYYVCWSAIEFIWCKES